MKTIKARCSKCGKEDVIQDGHIGKPHKKCDGRKKGSFRKINTGVWEPA